MKTRKEILSKEKEIMEAIKKIPNPIPFDYCTWADSENKIIIKKYMEREMIEIQFYETPIIINIHFREVLKTVNVNTPLFFKNFKRVLIEKTKFVLGVIKRPDLFQNLNGHTYTDIADMYKNKEITKDWVQCEKCNHIQHRKGVIK